jgi:hypothetical protein
VIVLISGLLSCFMFTVSYKVSFYARLFLLVLSCLCCLVQYCYFFSWAVPEQDYKCMHALIYDRKRGWCVISIKIVLVVYFTLFSHLHMHADRYSYTDTSDGAIAQVVGRWLLTAEAQVQ